MVSAESPDEQLVDAALGGDDHAYAELARRHKGRVFGVASRFARDGAELEDICQEVFIQAFQKLRQYRRDSPFEHWLLRITTHKCYDVLRKRRRIAPQISVDAMLESGHEPSAPEPVTPHPDLERLHAALGELSPKERLVITLLELEDRSVVEVAQPHRLEYGQRQGPRLSRPRRAAENHGALAMNDPKPDPQLDALFAQARLSRSDTSAAEYGFETRLMARLRERRQPEAASIFSLVTWRMMPFFAACVVALGLWQSDLTSETNDAIEINNVTNPATADLINSFN